MATDSANYNTFIEGYNEKFNAFANKVSAGFFDRVNVDMNMIRNNSEGLVKEKFEYLDKIIKDEAKNNYEKVKLTGSILSDITSDILNSGDATVKKSAVNIINSFFDVARRTEDNELLQTAKSIANSAKKG